MSTQYQHDPVHRLNSFRGVAQPISDADLIAPTRSDIVMRDDIDTNLEDVEQNFIDIPLVAEYTDWYNTPSPPTYQSAVDREMEGLFGPGNRAMRAILVPSTGETAAPLVGTPTHGAMTQIAHSCRTTTRCKWIGNGNSGACGAQVTCEGVPAHFGSAHGIRRLGRRILIDCIWEGCHKMVSRSNFTRHIRERHMGHHRKKGDRT